MMDRMPVEAPSSERELITGDLDDEQREAVLAARGPVCVLAGAGTGKTRTITRRIAHLVAAGHVAPGQVLAVTFTQRAAGEMRGRLRALDDGVGIGFVQAMTFHAAARRQLSYFWPRVVGDTGWQLLDTKFAVVAQSANRAGLQVSTDDVRDLAGEIEWAKASLISPEDYAATVAQVGRDIPLDAAKIATVYAGYETLKARRDGMALLDFDDLLLHTAAAIENDDAVAQEFRDRYRCFVVDEYQDVTPLQQRVLDAWLGGRDDLTVVGDANQTIYSFTGATPRYLLDFSRRFPDAAVVRLERDYRSTPQVVSLANRVIAAARGRMAGSKLHLVGQRDPGPAPSFTEHTDEVAEAAAVAKKIKNLIESGTAASEIAVLYRINAQSEVYEEALTEAGVPFQVRGGEGFFSRQEIRQALLALQRAAERGAADGQELPPLVRELLEPLGLTAESPTGTKARERWEALAALVELVDEEVAARPALDLRALVAELRQRADARHPPVVQGVTLASLHAAKGLEWDAVFLVGLTDTTIPIQHATTDEQLAEERRLLYVGITRARERLALSWALARSPGQRRGRRPSRFLDGLRPAGAVVVPRPKKKSAAPEAEDAELFGRLRVWRKRQADAQSVPAFVVFSDATLVAIADARPDSRTSLARVSGVGPAKLDRYAEPVLAVLGGADPNSVAPVEITS